MDKHMRRQDTSHWLWKALPATASCAVAILSGFYLFSEGVIGSLVSLIINIGLDQLRAQLIAALVMTVAAALCGAMLGRRGFPALLGAALVFGVSYLSGFIHLELQPVYDPGKHLEPLNTGNLVHTVMVMIALALLCAFIGSAVGVALSNVLFAPFVQLAQLIRQRRTDVAKLQTQSLLPQSPQSPQRTETSSGRKTVRMLVSSWLAAGMMVVLVLLAASSSDLFLFSPDTGLHSLPLIQGIKGHMQGTVVKDELVSAALGGQKRAFLVYLPPSYNTPAGRTKHYPTLYLLHGSPGTDIDWLVGGKASQSADTLIALGKIPELILVLPDGNGRAGATSEWANSFDQRQRIETFVAVDLVRYVDQKYRTFPEAAYRGIGGLSMGGFGAMNIAIHHPTTFGYVISLGGYYRAEGSIWGNNALYMRANSPLYVLPADKSAWKLHMYIGGATKDQPYYTDAQEFVQELGKLHVSYSFDVQQGFHSWTVWQTQLYNALLWLHWG